ncbi:MAG TPA: hypothetical protein VMN39_05875, partial [Longimicrobiaceae bacterium]|nr:hypothetical protein [Longimicrobiaceae bacterium]
SILEGTPSEIASAIQEYEPVVYDSELHTILIRGCNDAARAWIPLTNDIRESLILALENPDDAKEVLARLGNGMAQFERSAPLR